MTAEQLPRFPRRTRPWRSLECSRGRRRAGRSVRCADLGRHARDDKGIYSTVAQNHVQRRTFKRGHGNPVKDGFARER